MKVRFHRRVQKDTWDVMAHYESVSGTKLADEFYEELMRCVELALENPQRFHLDASGLRRANLERFPYHFLYRPRTDHIFILVLRHNKRHPSFGLRRKG